jgi:hypothetical protein
LPKFIESIGEPKTDPPLKMLKCLVSKLERETSLSEILHYLAEIERRRIFAIEGFGSLFDYCVKILGYSEGGANRRIQSMRLLRELKPKQAEAIEEKIESGALSLSVVAQAASFIYRNLERAKMPGTR